MKKTNVGAMLLAPLLVAPMALGSADFPAQAAATQHIEYMLTDQSLVIIPTQNQNYADLAGMYLTAAGFQNPDDEPIGIVNIPEYIPFSTLANTVDIGVKQLVEQVVELWDDGNGFNGDDPLYLLGYSQGAVVVSLAEQEFVKAGIPPEALHLVMIGDSASSQGGWLNSFLTSLESWLPEWVVTMVRQNLVSWGIAPPVLGATTPDGLYATDVWSLSGDGWANWDGGKGLGGMFNDHLWYLGLSQEDIDGAEVVNPDAVGTYDTVYHMIDSDSVNAFEALWNSFVMAVDFTQW
ncbi:PE-PPE domain-containing protein [[Mycobacterium] kokjensenii]|uniref:PE-PPE domain-containing protein n=1 Tax=[Mycobacterium] kokjensenii TaxID=3064287 RepID=A0ABM9LXV1_9MYCO|nr:PE-PPE domain-containing protein [Mycolicibacter sp. MU0083]CAJ1506528.1 PE-PPE domain-containing protein [Mycolicibacter sp. MU0083]